MKKSKFTEAHIAFTLISQNQEFQSMSSVRRLVFPGNILYIEAEVREMGVSEVRRHRQLEEENAKLKQIVADLSSDKQMLKDILKKRFESFSAQVTGCDASV